MKAIRIHKYGGSEQLRYEEIPVPALNRGQVLIRVYAASVNPIDCKLAAGMQRPILNNKSVNLPWIPGSDFSGIVEIVGPGVRGFRKGDAVYGNCPGGGAYASFVLAQPEILAHKPRDLSYIEAASVPVAAQTAWQALFEHGHLQSGQTVLIHGAAGGVGSFAIQLAHWKKAKVIATASENSIPYLRTFEVDQVVDYTTTPFESVVKDVDVVLDLIGGDTQLRSLKVLKAQGYLVSTVHSPSEEEARKHNVHAMMMSLKSSTEKLTRLAQLLDTGAIRTVVSKTYPLFQMRNAWDDILSGHTHGKIVLEVFHLRENRKRGGILRFASAYR